MNKKGFTLISLLLVIVVLGALLLFVYPTISNFFESVADNTDKESIKKYKTSIEVALARYKMLNPYVDNIVFEDIKDLVDYTGKYVTCDTIDLTDDKVKLDGCKVNIVEMLLSPTDAHFKFCREEEELEYENEAWNTTRYTCDVEIDEDEIVLNSYTFYLLSKNKDENGNVVSLNLIMGENLGDNVKWYSGSSNSYGPVDALRYLHEQTKKWRNQLNISSYAYDNFAWRNSSLNFWKGSNGYKTYKVDNGVGTLISSNNTSNVIDTNEEIMPINARLITGEELVSKCGTSNSCPEWLYKLSNEDGTYGIGVSHLSMSSISNSINSSLIINSNGNLELSNINNNIGIRPVITILPSNIKPNVE